MNCANKLEHIIQRVLAYLRLVAKYPDRISRSFYGETFAALSFCEWGQGMDEKYVKKFLTLYRDKEKETPEFHWEFNNYALIHMPNALVTSMLGYDYEIDRFKYTNCTNWILLRCLCQLSLKRSKQECLQEIDQKLKEMVTDSGLIKDNENVNSFQYHIFSAVLIYELYEKTQIEKYWDQFIKAVDFLINFILPNGCSIYIGRGQEQLFGYGLVLDALTIAAQKTGDEKYLYYLNSVLDYIQSFINMEMLQPPLPLTLNHEEKESEAHLDKNDIRHPGWYGYNNYLDYIAFFEYFTIRAYKHLKKVKILENSSNCYQVQNFMYHDKEYVVVKKERYMMTIAKGGGYWTNSQQLPILCYNNKIVLPCCGGEQYGCSLYAKEVLPLPYVQLSGLRSSNQNKVKGIVKRLLKKDDGKLFLFDCTDSKIRVYSEEQAEFIYKTEVLELRRMFYFEEESIRIVDNFRIYKPKAIKTLYVQNILTLSDAQKIGDCKIQLDKEVYMEVSNGIHKNPKMNHKACAMGKIENYVETIDYLTSDSIQRIMTIKMAII